MCMITYCPGNVEIPEWGIENGAWINDDGHGWAIAADIGVMLTGRFMSYDQAMTTFLATRKAYPHAPALFHSRWATHGVTGPRNVHPFPVGKHSVVAHNGVLPTTFHPTKDDPRSDTAIFAQEWLPHQTKGLWTRKERRRIGMAIGSGNKLAILTVSPKFETPRGFLVNQAYGQWVDGAWFSNDGYLGWGSRKTYSSSSYGSKWEYQGKSYDTFDDYYRAKYPLLAKQEDAKTETVELPDTDSAQLEVMRQQAEECTHCHSIGQIDWAGRVCNTCRTCLDCELIDGDADNPCLCWMPSKTQPMGNCVTCGEVAALCDCAIFCPDTSYYGMGWPE